MAEGIGALAVRIGADASDLIDAFNKADKSVEKFTNQVDRRLSQSLAKFATAAATAAAGLFMFAKRASDMVDSLDEAAQKVGMTIEQLSALKYAASFSNVSIEQLTTGLAKLSKFMVENGQAGEGVEERLLKIADQFATMPDGAQKTALAMQYFGRSGADLIPMLNEGRAGIERLKEEARRLGVVFNDEAAKAAREFNDNVDRLKASADGLSVQLAGPFVRAFNDAAVAMLNARKEGDGFLETLGQVMFRLTMGSDKQMIERQIASAGEALLKAQNRLDAARRGVRDAGPFTITQAKQELQFAEEAAKAAEASLKGLIAQKGILAPETPDQAKPKPGGGPGHTFTPEEMVAREEAVRAAMQKARESANKLELDQIKLQNEEKAKLTQQGLDQQVLAEHEAIEQRDALRLEEFRLRKEAEEAYDNLERRSWEERLAFERMSMRRKAQTIFGELANITAGVAQHNKTLFEINKVAGIANAIINAYEGISLTLAKYPYPVNIAMAAAHGLAAFAQVSAIRSASFSGGGGGAAPSVVGSTAAPAVTPVGEQRSAGPTIIQLRGGGGRFTEAEVRDFLEQIAEATRDGGKVVIAD